MTIIGVVAGIGLFLLTRPLVAKIPLDNATWFPASIVPPLVPAIVLLLADPGRRRRAPRSSRSGGSSSRRSASSAGRPRGCPASAAPIPLVASIAPAAGRDRVRCAAAPDQRARDRARRRRVRWRHRRDRAGRPVADVPRRSGAPCAARRRLDAARVAAADRRPARVVRGDRRGDHGGLRRERVLLVRGLRRRPGVRSGRRPRRGPGLRRDAVQRGTAVRRGPRPDRGRAGRPFRAADRDGRAHGDRPGHRLGRAVRRPRAAVRAAGRRVRRRLGQGPLGRWRHAARARLVHDHPGPRRPAPDHARRSRPGTSPRCRPRTSPRQPGLPQLIIDPTR